MLLSNHQPGERHKLVTFRLTFDVALLGIGSFLLTGCDARPPTASPEDPALSQLPSIGPGILSLHSLDTSHTFDPSVAPRNMDAEFEDIAEEAPEFGGLYFDDHGQPVAFLTDLTASGRMGTQLNGYLMRQRRDGSIVRFVRGEYSFKALADWRRKLDVLLGSGGVWSTDIDETENRVVVGVDSDAAWGLVIAEASRHEIPPEALRRVPSGPATPLVTVADYVRPVKGGLQIQFVTGGQYALCTLGFIVNNNYFTTNSHCSQTSGWVDNNSYWQAGYPSLIGSEIMDPLLFQGGQCLSGHTCRWSDALLAYFSTSDTDFGYIARTTGLGSKTIATGYFSRFHILETRAYPIGGEQLNKVGRSTGWTAGPVTLTCVNITVNGWTRLCQDKVDLFATSGDSGSPVFERMSNGNDVRLYGLLWGLHDGDAVFSSLANLEYELGALTYFPW